MIPDAHRYLEHLCDTFTADTVVQGGQGRQDKQATIPGSAGAEPFGTGALLRLSPTRTKRVMRELLAHGLLAITVVPGEDGRNELRVIPTHETTRWYARTLRQRAAARRYAMQPAVGTRQSATGGG